MQRLREMLFELTPWTGLDCVQQVYRAVLIGE